MNFHWGLQAYLSVQAGFICERLEGGKGLEGKTIWAGSNVNEETGARTKMSTNRRLDKLCVTHKMKRYTAVKGNRLLQLTVT